MQTFAPERDIVSWDDLDGLVAGLADRLRDTRFDLLLAAKEHEMHHRGQLMLIERINGIVPHITRRMQERMAQTQAPAAR